MKRVFVFLFAICSILCVMPLCNADEFDFEEFDSGEEGLGDDMGEYAIETEDDDNTECRMTKIQINRLVGKTRG